MEPRRAKPITSIVIAVLLAGIAAAVWFWREPAETGARGIVKADRWEQVKAYQYEKTPGLERAEKLGLTRGFDKEIPVPDSSDSVMIHEVWANRANIFFFYSVSLKSLPADGEAPVVSFRVKNGQADPSEHSLFTLNWSPNEGVYYQGRLYGRAVTNPFWLDGKALDEWSGLELIDLSVRQGDLFATALPSVSLPVDYRASNEIVETYPIGQSYGDGERKLEVDRLELGTSENRLFFRFSAPNGDRSKPMQVQVRLRTDQGETREARIVENFSAVGFEPFNKRPGRISIEWEAVRYMDRDLGFEFTLDGTKIQEDIGKRQGMVRMDSNERIDRLLHTDILLNELIYDERGLDFSILYESDKGLKKPYVRLASETPNSIPVEVSEEDRERNSVNLPLIVRVFNADGEEKSIGQRGSGSGERYDAFIENPFGEEAEELRVSVTNLLVEWGLDWKTEVTIPAGR